MPQKSHLNWLIFLTVVILLGSSLGVTWARSSRPLEAGETWPPPSVKLQLSSAYNIPLRFWHSSFPEQCAFLEQRIFNNQLNAEDIRLLGDYLLQQFLAYLTSDNLLSQEVESIVLEKPRDIKKYLPYQNANLEFDNTVRQDGQMALPPRRLILLKLHKLHPGETYFSPLAQYLEFLGHEQKSENVTLLFDGELEFKHYQGYYAPTVKSLYFSATVFGQILAARNLSEVFTNPTVAHENFHVRQAQLGRQNIATLSAGMVSSTLENIPAAIKSLTNQNYQEPFYLEEAFAHTISLRYLLQDLQQKLESTDPGQKTWTPEAWELKFKINRRFQRCFTFLMGAWRINTYVYHAFPSYLTSLDQLDDPTPDLPFIAENNLIYLPVNHSFLPPENDDPASDPDVSLVSYPYYYIIPLTVLAEVKTLPNQKLERLDEVMILNQKNLLTLQEFVRQQNSYWQELALELHQLWLLWLRAYDHNPHTLKTSMPELLHKAQDLPWPRAFPPGRSSKYQHQVPTLEQIDAISDRLLNPRKNVLAK